MSQSVTALIAVERPAVSTVNSEDSVKAIDSRGPYSSSTTSTMGFWSGATGGKLFSVRAFMTT